MRAEDSVMSKRKEPKLTPAEQIKRFREAAKKAEVTTDEKEFERAFRAVAPGLKASRKKK